VINVAHGHKKNLSLQHAAVNSTIYTAQSILINSLH